MLKGNEEIEKSEFCRKAAQEVVVFVKKTQGRLQVFRKDPIRPRRHEYQRTPRPAGSTDNLEFASADYLTFAAECLVSLKLHLFFLT